MSTSRNVTDHYDLSSLIALFAPAPHARLAGGSTVDKATVSRLLAHFMPDLDVSARAGVIFGSTKIGAGNGGASTMHAAPALLSANQSTRCCRREAPG
jgi:hypothetical protein